MLSLSHGSLYSRLWMKDAIPVLLERAASSSASAQRYCFLPLRSNFDTTDDP